MGQGGGKETPVLPLLPVQLVLQSNFPCPQQRDARRGAGSAARGGTHHLPTESAYRWIHEILKNSLVRSLCATILFISRSWHLFVRGSSSGSNTRG